MTGKLGSPPTVFHVEPVDLRTYDGDLWRVHQIVPGRPGWNQLRYYGPVPGMRFDPQTPPLGPSKPEGVQYLATTAAAALAEVFQGKRRIITTRPNSVLVAWKPTRPLTLLDLNGHFAIRNGGAATLAAGSKRNTQLWARAVHNALPDIDGLWHRSSMTGDDLVTLFTRSEAVPVFPTTPSLNRRLDDAAVRSLILAVADKIHYEIA